jgi:hypothetical protein
MACQGIAYLDDRRGAVCLGKVGQGRLGQGEVRLAVSLPRRVGAWCELARHAQSGYGGYLGKA